MAAPAGGVEDGVMKEVTNMEVGDVVLLIDEQDQQQAWCAQQETLSSAHGEQSRFVLRKEPAGCSSLPSFDGSPSSLATARQAQFEVDVPLDSSDASLPTAPGRIGLKGCGAGGRYLQAVRKGPRKLLLASSRLGASETWEVGGTESHGTLLRNQRFPGNLLRVRVFRVGNTRDGTALPAASSSAVTIPPGNEHEPNYAEQQPTVLHEMSNLLLDEWNKALHSEVEKRQALHEKLQALREEQSRLKHKMQDCKVKALSMVESIDNEVLLRLASQVWVIMVRSKRKKALKAHYQNIRRRTRTALDRWRAYGDLLEQRMEKVRNRCNKGIALQSFSYWYKQSSHAQLLYRMHSKMKTVQQQKLLFKGLSAFEEIVFSKRTAEDVLKAMYFSECEQMLKGAFEHWKERAVDLVRGAVDYGATVSCKRWFTVWKSAVIEEKSVQHGQRKLRSVLTRCAFSGWADRTEFKRDSREAAAELQSQRQLLYVQDCFSELRRVVAQLRDARIAAADQIAFADGQLKHNVLNELRKHAEENRNRQRIEHYFKQAHSTLRPLRRALGCWADAYSTLLAWRVQKRSALLRCQALRTRVAFDVWLANIEEWQWEERMVRRAVERMYLLRARRSFERLRANADESAKLANRADTKHRSYLLKKAFQMMHGSIVWEAEALQSALYRLRRALQRIALERWKQTNESGHDKLHKADFLRCRNLSLAGFTAFITCLETRRWEDETANAAAKRLQYTLLRSALQGWAMSKSVQIDSEARAASFRKRKLLSNGFTAIAAAHTQSKHGAEVSALHVRGRAAMRVWRHVKSAAQERESMADRMAGWRESSLCARSFREWLNHVDIMQRGMQEAEKRFNKHSEAHKATLVHQSFYHWKERKDEKVEAFDNVERVIKAKQIAKESFLRWYWDAFAPEIQNALRVLNRSMDESIHDQDQRMYAVVRRSQNEGVPEDDAERADMSPARNRRFYRAFTEDLYSDATDAADRETSDGMPAAYSPEIDTQQAVSPAATAVIRAASPARETLAYDPEDASFVRFHGSEPERQYAQTDDAAPVAVTRRRRVLDVDTFADESSVAPPLTGETDGSCSHSAAFAVSPDRPDDEAEETMATTASMQEQSVHQHVYYEFDEDDDQEVSGGTAE